jgi:IS5 family transposase
MQHRALLGLVAADLGRHGVKETGRHGLPAESELRCAVLQQHRQLSYQELAFHLEDSASFRAFARLPGSWDSRKSALHKTISAIRAETWEAINRVLLSSAAEAQLQRCRVVASTARSRQRWCTSRVTAACYGSGPGDGPFVAGGERVGRRRRARLA